MSFDLVVRNAVLILTFLFLLGDQVSAQAPFYQGKHTPGNPDVVVQNMPGAGSQVAANHIYNVAKPDGLTIGSFNPALYFNQLVGQQEAQFDWGKFTWI